MQIRKPKIYSIILFLCFLFLIKACASHLPGDKGIESGLGEDASPQLEVSLKHSEPLSSRQYQGYQISFYNRTDDWIKVERVQLSFPNLKDQPPILIGEKLNAYLSSVARRNHIDSHNRQLWLGGLFALGGIAIGTTLPSSQESRAGQILALGAASMATVDGILQSKEKASFQQSLPQNHLMTAFWIPPHLSVAKWVVMEQKTLKYFKEAKIVMHDEQGSKREFNIADTEYQGYLEKKNRSK